MKRIPFIVFIVTTLLIGMGGYDYAKAESEKKQDPLIERLIQKGVLTEEDAAEIRQQDKGFELPKGLKGVKVGALWYLDYSNGKAPESGDESSSYNSFRITRGYLTVKKELHPWFHTRITIDTHQDDTWDYKNRLKYIYAELRPPDAGLFTDMKSEIGMGHVSWLDFEEHVNAYRCQGTMAIERAGVFNSADVGVSLRGYFGGELEDAEEKTESHYYPGTLFITYIAVSLDSSILNHAYPYLSGLAESQWAPNFLLDSDITEDLLLSQEREKIVTES